MVAGLYYILAETKALPREGTLALAIQGLYVCSSVACAACHVVGTKGHGCASGEGSWQAELTPHKLSHTSIWGYLTQGLTLLGNLCGLSAVIKEVSAAINQVSCLCILIIPLIHSTVNFTSKKKT